MKGKTQPFAIALFIVAVFSLSMVFISAIGASQNDSHHTYDLTLVITTANTTGASSESQYLFYQLENNSLVSSSVITVPAATEIMITIINHDNGTSVPMIPSATGIEGVVGNQVFISSTVGQAPVNPLSLPGSEVSGSVISANLSHTFSTSTGVNIPIVPHSTEVAYTYFENTGTFSWACMCQCGQFSMDTPGWMMGEIVVVPP